MKNIVNILLALAFSASVAFADDKMPAASESDNKDAAQVTTDAATTTAPAADDTKKDEKSN